MDKVIVWNKKAQAKFDNIVLYLQKEWSERIAENFVKTTNHYLFLLSKFPYLGRKSSKNTSVRLLNITRHNQMFYRVESKKIIILAFFDLRQDSIKKTF